MHCAPSCSAGGAASGRRRRRERRMAESSPAPAGCPMSVVRHASPDAFLASAQPVIDRDEAMASSYVAGARAPSANPRDADTIYLATYANGDAFGAAIRRGGGPLWVGPSDARPAAAFAEDLFAASYGSTAT